MNHASLNSTATPVFGSATAETSATVRRAQPGSVSHTGFGPNALQPLAAPLHAGAVHPRAPAALRSDVPPTAVTSGDAAAYETPKPPPPELAVGTRLHGNG